KAGKLRALAITGINRTPMAPGLPTLSESGLPGYDVSGWMGFMAPAGTPREVVQKWSLELSRILQLPDTREWQLSQGLEPVGSTPEHFAEFIKAEIAKWGTLVKQSGIKADR
ncbi:MAG: tripartite tricarboxylate transporter substrate binding protein, partial [Betaproteobacteria bacterium]|nr:tripartite tricarboxylate transporter substrate binding protein [Betaproteobacteria bacterium]